MAVSVRSNAIPVMLEWARKSAGYSAEDVAAKLGIQLAELQDWEAGNGSPSMARLTKLGKLYKRPLHVFYLASPPTEFTVVKDYRLLPPDRSRDFSPRLISFIRETQERQAWLEEYLQEIQTRPVQIKITGTNPQSWGRQLREELGLTVEKQVSLNSDLALYHFLRTECEDRGITVFQASGIPLEEMRGLALPEAWAPALVVNAKDSYSARSFTLIHELAHVLLGQTAISGGRVEEFASPQVRDVEKFCNQVAAETLVPEDDLRTQLSMYQTSFDELIPVLACRYRVSHSVIVIRLFEAGYVTREFVDKRINGYEKSPSTVGKQGSRERKIPRSKLIRSRLGGLFSKSAVAAYHSGEIHGAQLSKLLGMSMRHLPRLERLLYPSRIPFEPERGK